MFPIGSSSINLGFDCNSDGINGAILLEKKEFIKKKIRISCQSLTNSDHQVPAANFDLMILSSKITAPGVSCKVEIFMEETEPALME